MSISEKRKAKLIKRLKTSLAIITGIVMLIMLIVVSEMPQYQLIIVAGARLCMIISIFIAMCFLIMAYVRLYHHKENLANKNFGNFCFMMFYTLIFAPVSCII